MRSTVLLMLIFFSLAAKAQEIRVKRVNRVFAEGNGSYILAGVMPDARQLLLAGEGYNGLSLLDIRRGTIRVISSETGAGYEPAVSSDGRKVIYRSDSFENSRKYSSVYSFDMATGEKQLLVEKERGVLPPAISGNALLIKSDVEMRINQLPATVNVKSKTPESFVVIEDMIPVIYRGEERIPLMPNGDGFYIWASLSPDGTMILYNYQGRSTYICDITGKVLHELGRINAPKWLSNTLVIGMDDRDDGYRIIASELVYYSLINKKRTLLTNTENRSEMFPFPMDRGRGIAFSTDKGEVYVMKIRIR